jgi:hypothetical protein
VSAPTTSGGVEDPAAELEGLRDERDRLRAEIESYRGRRHGHLRRVAVVVLVLASCVLFIASSVGIWARRNFLDTDRFVARVGPLVEEPVVQAALTDFVTAQIMGVVDSRRLFESVLPERGRILAVPLRGALEQFVRERTASFVSSEPFARLWEQAVAVAHREAVRVLRGQSAVVSTEATRIDVDLVPVLDAVLARITAASPEILGRTVDIPDVTVASVPGAVKDRLGQALGVDLGEGFGRFTVYDDGKLRSVQDAVALADRYVVALLVAAVALAGGALWLSDRRRRTLLQLCAGVVLGMVLLRRAGFRLPGEVAALPPGGPGRAVAGLAAERFVEPLLTFAAGSIVVAAVIAVAALLTGGYPWAVAVRGASVRAGGRVLDPATATWVGAHRDALLVGAVVVSVAALWLVDVSWVGLVAVMAGLAAFGTAVQVIATRVAAAPPPT